MPADRVHSFGAAADPADLEECNGGWYYKLMHKRARRHGPFDSGCAASDAAVDAGFKVAEV
jgi:hypothetical protein